MIVKAFILIAVVFSIAIASLSTTFANASILDPACSSGNADKSAVCAGKGGSSNPVISNLEKITKIIAFVTGAAAVIMILIGSIQYVISNGDANRVSSAKNTIIYALVGVAVVALSASLIEFVLNRI